MPEQTKLYAPDGREYVTSDPVEVTRLRGHGYRLEKPTKRRTRKASASKSSDAPAPTTEAE